jgi:hypothetical protein
LAGSCSNTDGLLDVIGIQTLFHLGITVSSQMRLVGGMYRVAQASSIDFEFTDKSDGGEAAIGGNRVPFQVCCEQLQLQSRAAAVVAKPLGALFTQVDGEPFVLVNPKRVRITKAPHVALMLKAPSAPASCV